MFGLALAVAPYGALAGEAVTYEVNGEAFEGYQAAAEGDSKGLVIVIHDWDGLTDYEKMRTDMLAKMGYDAFAVDLFGKGNRPTETEAKIAETRKLREDRDRMRSLTFGALEAARQFSDRDAVLVGYCFGGAPALEVARSGQAEGVAGYVTFHGSISTPEGQSYSADTAPILVAHGGADTVVKMDDVLALSNELESAGVPYEIQVYSGADHGFTEPGTDSYQETADKQSWDALTDFLETQLSG
jgi:dienelactone hydrolase